jgi:hypothetical protein
MNVPAPIRHRDRLIGTSEPVLTRYERIAFETFLIAPTNALRSCECASKHPALGDRKLLEVGKPENSSREAAHTGTSCYRVTSAMRALTEACPALRTPIVVRPIRRYYLESGGSRCRPGLGVQSTVAISRSPRCGGKCEMLPFGGSYLGKRGASPLLTHTGFSVGRRPSVQIEWTKAEAPRTSAAPCALWRRPLQSIAGCQRLKAVRVHALLG